MTHAPFLFAGVEMHGLLSGALYMPGCSTLVFADLHLEKGSGMARRGAMLPPYDSRATLAAMAASIAACEPRTVVCLGDSFHDGHGPSRLTARDRARLRQMMVERLWIWVVGNHDSAETAFIGGTVCREVRIGAAVLRHQAAAEAGAEAGVGEISGHFHPKASIGVRGRRVSGRCFVSDERRLIMPAFGAYAGGLDVFDAALAAVLEPVFSVHLIGHRKVHSIASTALRRPSSSGS